MAAGRNVTLTVQLVPAARLGPQVLVCEKPVPAAMLAMLIAADRLLVTVRLEAVLLVLIAWLGKLIAAGEIVTGITPLPVSETLWGEFAAESVMTRVEE